MTTAVIVGGSLTGMAAAARLAKAGHTVVLLERRDRLGGRAAGRHARRDHPAGGLARPVPEVRAHAGG